MTNPDHTIETFPPRRLAGELRSEQAGLVYESQAPYEAARIHAAALYCSDGRFGGHCDDFLYNGLGLPRYDRVVIPGGPACLADYYAVHWEGDALIEQISFLIEKHDLHKMVLIAHENCAYYLERLHIGQRDLRQRQHEDLRKAVTRLRQRFSSSLTVESYFAGMRDGRVCFEQVMAPDELRDAPRTQWI